MRLRSLDTPFLESRDCIITGRAGASKPLTSILGAIGKRLWYTDLDNGGRAGASLGALEAILQGTWGD